MWITPGQPTVVLAPMEGLTDGPMRAYLTAQGGIDYCVAEFLRVSGQLYPRRVFSAHAEESATGWHTASGTPVQLQLLGGDAEMLAQNALRAVTEGAIAIDLNFGCPAPTVNRHDGGATLLKHPCRLEAIVATVRQRVPKEIPVSAKVRLGWEDTNDIFENAKRVEAGGADWLTVHARTRVQGYARPVYWEKIGAVRKQVSIPVVANGDIWSAQDFLDCRATTGCEHFMLGRGAVADPALALWVWNSLRGLPPGAYSQCLVAREVWRERFLEMIDVMQRLGYEPWQIPPRLKQWLRYASLRQPVPWFDEIKVCQSHGEILQRLT